MDFTFTKKEYGFNGMLYKADKPMDRNKILIVCGGSDGIFERTKEMAQTLTANGIDTLALAFIHAPGLPRHIIKAPLESAANAVKKLQNLGYSKIGIYGFSSGGEYALMAASILPQITCVVAVSALSAISQADNGFSYKNTSCWTWKKRELPYMEINYSVLRAIPLSLKKREPSTTFLYEKGIERADKKSWIKVERINGPILFLTARQDSICPSFAYAEHACRQLEEHDFPYPKKHVSFLYASHFLLPEKVTENVPLKLFHVERKYPAKCAKSREKSLEITLDWLNNWLSE